MAEVWKDGIQEARNLPFLQSSSNKILLKLKKELLNSSKNINS